VARWQSCEPSYCAVDAERLIANQHSNDLPDRGGWIQLAIRDADTGSLYGDIGIHVIDDQPDTFEIGVTLAPGAQGRGIGTEAVERVLSCLFGDAGAHRVIAFCDARNAPVARLLRRVGMRHESHHSRRTSSRANGQHGTVLPYSVEIAERGARAEPAYRLPRPRYSPTPLETAMPIDGLYDRATPTGLD
jgi:RimJ/RimL family protein N-acetyltransferase